MSKSFVMAGKILRVLAGAAILTGEVVVIGNMIGVAEAAAANGDWFSAAVKEVHSLTKKAALVIAQGEALYWDTVAKEITKTASADTVFAGMAAKAAAAEDAEVAVDLNVDRRIMAEIDALGAAAVLVGVDGAGNNAAPLVGTQSAIDDLYAKVDEILAEMKAKVYMVQS